MNLEAWRAAKRRVRVEDYAAEHYEFEDGTEEILVYPGGLVIECREEGRFLLQLPMEQEVSADLGGLEARLYEFGLDISKVSFF